MSGKGSKRRPQQVPDEQVKDAWDRIFGKPEEPIKLSLQGQETLAKLLKQKSEPTQAMRDLMRRDKK